MPLSKEQLLTALRPVTDPELGYSVVDLGLIYDVRGEPDGACTLTYTLTSPACPLGDVLERDVRSALTSLPGVTAVNLRLTFDPPWSAEKIAPSLRRELRLQGFPV